MFINLEKNRMSNGCCKSPRASLGMIVIVLWGEKATGEHRRLAGLVNLLK